MASSAEIVATDTGTTFTVTFTSSDTSVAFTNVTECQWLIGMAKTITATIVTQTATELVTEWTSDGLLTAGVYSVRGKFTWNSGAITFDTGAPMSITVDPTP